jgi:RNA polymerase sigma-70 factor, ECF subfamily
MSEQGAPTPRNGAGHGGRAEADRLTRLVYEELRRLAHHRLRHERSGHTFSTTDLVHEAYLKLARLDRIRWQSRPHFRALAAQAMRRVLVDHAVGRKRLKRGGDAQRVTLDEDVLLLADTRAEELLALDQAMSRLEVGHHLQARVVECRFFGGMTVAETAEALDLSPATIKRDWVAARAWLHRELKPD